MVYAYQNQMLDSELNNFYRLSYGANTAKIQGQSGSLMTLPVAGDK